MANSKKTIKLKAIKAKKGADEKAAKKEITVPFAQALKILKLQDKKKVKAWEVSEPNYKYQNGEIEYTGSEKDSKKA